MKRDFNATLIGYRGAEHAAIVVNPDNDITVSGGELFYIASRRICAGALA